MKVTRILLTVCVALAIQMAASRFAIGGRWVFDLVLVGVVYSALKWGPVAGMWTGTLGGLFQDALGTGVVGIGGLAKTIIGLVTGVAGAQFVVSRPSGCAAMVAGATLVHRLIVLGLQAVVAQDWFGVPWTAMLIETVLNATAGFLAFHLTDRLPGAVQQTRVRRRSSLSRRNW